MAAELEAVDLSPAAVAWLVRGEHGLSSRAMFDHAFYGRPIAWRARTWWDYPHDLDDFRRCELLLREVPELRPRLSEMAACGPVWAALVEVWDIIVRTAEQHMPTVFTREARRGYWDEWKPAARAVQPIMDAARAEALLMGVG